MIDSRHRAPEWQSRQMVVTPEQLGLRSVGDCRDRAERLGLTALPIVPYKQEYWRLDELLHWSRGNGFEYLPMLGVGIAPRHKSTADAAGFDRFGRRRSTP